MKCSECSKTVRPVVVVDIDGTLGDYHGHFMDFAEGYFGSDPGWDIETYDGTGNFGNWVCEVFECERKSYRDCKLAYRQGAQKRTMPTFLHASDFMHTLKAQDVELWIATTRPYQRLDNIDPDTRSWLERNDIPYDGLLYSERKYKDLVEQIDPMRIVAVVDDLRENLEDAFETLGREVGILKRSAWNRGVSWPWVHDSLRSIGPAIEARLYDWRVAHG